MLDPLVLSAVTLTNLHKARKHFEKMERVDSPSMVSLCIEFCQMFFLRMLNCLLLPTSFFFFFNIHDVLALKWALKCVFLAAFRQEVTWGYEDAARGWNHQRGIAR